MSSQFLLRYVHERLCSISARSSGSLSNAVVMAWFNSTLRAACQLLGVYISAFQTDGGLHFHLSWKDVVRSVHHPFFAHHRPNWRAHEDMSERLHGRIVHTNLESTYLRKVHLDCESSIVLVSRRRLSPSCAVVSPVRVVGSPVFLQSSCEREKAASHF